MKLLPIVNTDADMSEDMAHALSWFETLCRMRGVYSVTKEDVIRHLAEEGETGLAAAFNPSMLYELPADPQ